MLHHITSVNLQVHARGRVDGLTLQHDISHWFWGECRPALETLFDKISPEQEVIRIDKLDITIPPLHTERWQEDLSAALVTALREKLGALVHAAAPSGAGEAATDRVFLETKTAGKSAVVVETGLTRRSLAQNHFESWLFFLKNGRLPLHHAAANEPERLRAVLEYAASDTRAATILKDLLQRDATALQRLVLQHDTLFLGRLAAALADKEMGDLGQIWADVSKIATDAPFTRFVARVLQQAQKSTPMLPPEARGLERLFWEEAFTILIAVSPPFEARFFVEHLFKRVFKGVFAMSFEELVDKVIQRTALSHKRADFTLDKLEKILLKSAKGAVLEGYFKDVIQAAQTRERDNHVLQAPDAPYTDEAIPVSTKKEARQDVLSDATTPSSGVPAPKPMTTDLPPAKEGATGDATLEVPAPDSNIPVPKATALPPEKAERGAVSTPDTTAPDSDIPAPNAMTAVPSSTEKEGSQDTIPSKREEGRAFSKNKSDDTKNVPAAAEPEPDTLYLQDAGLVLLHPFLPTLFAAGKLTEAGVFIDETAHAKAVQWLHYLATGTTHYPEYALMLPKLLCGMAFSQPIDRHNLLTEDDLNEGETLLRAVIKHWGVLGDVSSDSLREGFLRRDGKLSRREDGGWRLQVETKTLDILLNRLPWGIGLIKLKWMKDMLHVDWN